MEKYDVIFLNAAWENVSTCPTTVFARSCMNWLMFLVAIQFFSVTEILRSLVSVDYEWILQLFHDLCYIYYVTCFM